MATTSTDGPIADPVTSQTPNADGKITYDAACHCHAIEYKIIHAPLTPPYTGANTTSVHGSRGPNVEDKHDQNAPAKPPLCFDCNCSICVKNGYLLIYPKREDVIFTKGYDTLQTYQFAARTVEHKFCPNCGSSLFIDLRGKFPVDILGVNARMIQDFDLNKIQAQKVDGRQRSPEYNNQSA